MPLTDCPQLEVETSQMGVVMSHLVISWEHHLRARGLSDRTVSRNPLEAQVSRRWRRVDLRTCHLIDVPRARLEGELPNGRGVGNGRERG